MTAQILDFEDKFGYSPRDSFYYGVGDGENTAWANCLPPKSHPPIIATFINGSSGLPPNENDPRVTIKQLIRDGMYSQIIIKNATQADAGRWACVAKHAFLGERKAYFNVSYYGETCRHYCQKTFMVIS